MLKKLILFIPIGSLALNACSANQAAPVEITKSGHKATHQKYQAKSQKVHKKKVTFHKEKVSHIKTLKQEAIPRDDNNKPIYSKIDRGFYDEAIYTVRKGDTLFFISYISDKDVKELADINHLKEPYPLKVGQKIKLSRYLDEPYPLETKQKAKHSKAVNKKIKSKKQAVHQKRKVAVVAPKNEPKVTYTKGANGTLFGSDGSIKGPIKATAGHITNVPAHQSAASHSLRWHWPTTGKIIKYFSNVGENKGIDIEGSKGQIIRAAYSGKVVYARDALQGYGNLIIIKHNDDYLSAYAHNDEILVKEQQDVVVGQKIAKMGSTGTEGTKLHFEIRYKGKSVNPMDYLPKR